MSFKIEHTPQTVNSSEKLLCCFDVSKASLSLYTEYRPQSQADTEACPAEEEALNERAGENGVVFSLRGLLNLNADRQVEVPPS